MHGETMKIQ